MATPILTIGSSGDQVKQLQSSLGITADGIYGNQTAGAVKAYQQKNGLTVDGIVGNQTLGKLYPATPTVPNGGTPAPTPTAPAPLPSGGTPATGIPTGTPSAGDINAAATAAFATPSKNSQQVYQDAYSAAGLSTIKAKIDNIDSQIKAKQDQLAEALGTINENPFLDEKTRVGRGKNITDTANAELSNLQAAKTSASDLYNAGLNEVNGVVTRNSADFSADQTVAQNKLTYLQKLAEDAVQQAKDAKTAPTTIGDASVGFYRWDPALQKFIQTIAPKPTNTASTLNNDQYARTAVQEMSSYISKIADSNGYVTPAQYKAAKNEWVSKTGLPPTDFDKNFSGKAYLNTAYPESPYSATSYGLPATTGV